MNNFTIHKQSNRIKSWIDDIQDLCKFKDFVIYDPILEDKLINEMVDDNILLRLNHKLRPNSYLARSSIDDVARLESRTFICTSDDNPIKPKNWRSTTSMKLELFPLYKECMINKTAYIVPFVMGPLDETGICGLIITDSPYVAVSTGIMSRTGYEVLQYINNNDSVPIIKCLHSTGRDDTKDIGGLKWNSSSTKWICHFPEEDCIYSYGSGYGGNAILTKKCLALRIASYKGYQEGWYAEHMMLISLTNKVDNKTIYIAGAFPSACGKTNMAMLKSKLPEWEVKTIGDDITWLRIINGRLHGMNPETGFFGVAPNTSPKTNPICIDTISKNTIFTNVGLTSNYDIWWEGYNDKPCNITNWKGVINDNNEPIAHPNSRFTVRANQCPQWSFEDDKKWVPISAIIFGGKRNTSNMPLIREATSFEHGILMGATLSSETTAASSDTITGTIRYDPFAMLPFFGYNISSYFSHWLNMKNKLQVFPHIYYINLFGKDDGKFIWPGYSENIHLLIWIYNRIINNIDYITTPIGNLPINSKDIDFAFWKQQLLLDKQHLIDNKSPDILIHLINNINETLS